MEKVNMCMNPDCYKHQNVHSDWVLSVPLSTLAMKTSIRKVMGDNIRSLFSMQIHFTQFYQK